MAVVTDTCPIKNLSEVLFDDLQLKPVKKRSTASNVLHVLKNYHPIAEELLEYRHLNKLVNTGNTVVVIEHNLDVIKNSDWIIDLGPEGGVNGGKIVAEGTPEEVAKCKKSYTGKYIKKYLNKKFIL